MSESVMVPVAVHDRSRRLRRRLAAGVVALVVVVAVFWGFLPALADYGDVWRILRSIPAQGMLIAGAWAVVNLASYPAATLAVIPGLGYRRALAARLASTSAANTLPGGGGVGVGITSGMLAGWGVPGDRIVSAIALTGLWNNAIKLVLPAIALVLVAVQGSATTGLIDAALIGVVAAIALAVAFIVTVRQRSGVARGLDRLWARLGGAARPGSAVEAFLATLSNASSQRWLRLAVATLAAHISLFFVLLASLRAVGVHPMSVHWSEAFASFAIIRLVSVVPLTPGGLGVAEVGLAAILGAGLPNLAVEQIVAGVLAFRFLTFLVPTPLGGVVGFEWWRRKRTARARAWHEAPEVLPEHLEEAVCHRCGLSGTPRYDLDPFRLVECPGCGQAFISPRLNDAGRSAMYGRTEYFDDGVYGSEAASRLQRAWTAGRLGLVRHWMTANQIRPSPRLYEIGCAFGRFLDAARKDGFTVGGLEYSAVAAGVAGEALGIHIDVGEATEYHGAAEHDVVVAWDVIEHTPDPGAFLRATARLTVPGGLVAFSCPYFDSIPARLMGRRWWTLKPQKHIWHFRVADLRRLMDDAGLDVLDVVRSPLARSNLGRTDSLVMVGRRRGV